MADTLARKDQGLVTYFAEFVITTLADDFMFKYHQIGNIGVFTPEVAEYVLSHQTIKNWQLGRCDFRHQFLYKWESENLLVALCDIPKPFASEWRFTYDTTTYPWTVNIVRADDVIGCELRYRKNMQGVTRKRDVRNLFTRIYPLGHGEGDNQLTIARVNNGIPYLEAGTVKKYGIKSVPWIDRRFEDAANMMATAAAMLKKFSVPFVSYAVESIDLFKKTRQDFDKLEEGKKVRVIDKRDGINIDTRIMEIEKPDVTKPDIRVTIANRERNIAGSIAEHQRNQRIHDTYAQGSETVMQIPFIDNCQPGFPAIFEFFIPANMVNINFATLRIRLEPFRANSRAVRGGGGRTGTSTAGGGVSASTNAGGATTQTTTTQAQQASTTQSGGATTSGASSTSTTQNQPATSSGASNITTTQSGGGVTSDPSNISVTASQPEAVGAWRITGVAPTFGAISLTGVPPHSHSLDASPIIPSHSHGMSHTHNIRAHTHDMIHTHTIPGHGHDMPHTHTISGHIHQFTIPSHSHSVTIPTHQHSVTIPAHYHNITMPDHTHEIEFGIFQGTRAQSISIRVDDNTVPIAGSLDNVDIRPFLRRDGGGRIVRNTWHRFEVIPDRMTRISAHLFLIFSSNSRGGDTL